MAPEQFEYQWANDFQDGRYDVCWKFWPDPNAERTQLNYRLIVVSLGEDRLGRPRPSAHILHKGWEAEQLQGPIVELLVPMSWAMLLI